MSELNDDTGLPTTASYWPGYGSTSSDTSPSDAPYKRSGKSQRDLLACYIERCKVSKKWRKEKYDDTWKRLVDLYRGKQLSGLSKDDRIVINIVFSTVNVIVPSIAVNDPKITVNARTPEQDANAGVAEAAVNYWWRHYDWKHEIKRTVKDSITIGHGWVKVGWKYSEKATPVPQEQQQAQYAELQAQADAAAYANPAIAAELPSDEDIYAMLDTHEWQPDVDCPFVERVSPFDIFIDPEATDPADLKWIAQRIVMPIEAVKADKRYDQAARNELKADMATNARWRDENTTKSQSDTTNDDIKRVTIWEYWDIQHEFYCVYSEGAKRFLLKPTDFPYPFGHPFFFLPNYEVTDQFYPIGDVEQIEPIQYELNGVRSDMMNHRKRYQRAYVYLRDKFQHDAISILTSSEDGRMVPVEGDEDLNRLIMPIPQQSLDPQMYNYSEVIESDLELVSGVTEFQRGSAPETRRTATEAQMLNNATNARVSDKLAQVETFMADVAEAIIQLAQMYMHQDEAAKIVGQNGEVTWQTFAPDEIQGEFDFTVEAGSTQPKDENFKRQQALELFQAMQPFLGEVIDPKAMVTYVLREAYDIKDPSAFFPQQPAGPPPPNQKIIENLNYKDLPPDIQRQVEQQAGFQPSGVGGSSQAEKIAAEQGHQVDQQAVDQAHEQEMQDQQHQQEMLMAQQQQQAAAEAAAQAPAEGQ